MPIARALSQDEAARNRSAGSLLSSSENTPQQRGSGDGRQQRRRPSRRDSSVRFSGPSPPVGTIEGGMDKSSDRPIDRSARSAEMQRIRLSFSQARGLTAGDIGWFRHKCGAFIDDPRTMLVVLLLIVVNAAMIGVATLPLDDETTRVFNIVDMVILVIFTVESSVQFTYHGPRHFLTDGWLVFDAVIVVISWVSLEVPSLEAFRVMRVLRLVTQVAVLRNVVVALLSIVPSIAAIFALLLLIFYIFGVMFTTLFKEDYPVYFGGLQRTWFTLFQFLCLDEWSGIAYEVGESYSPYPLSWLLFIVFIVMSAFVVINLLIAVICDALQILRTAEVTLREEMELEKEFYGGMDPAPGEEEGEEWTGEGKWESGRFGEGGGQWSVAEENRRMRARVGEMQAMLDEMAATQEAMALTVRSLTLALCRQGGGRSPDVPERIREAMAEGTSRDGVDDGPERLDGVRVLTNKMSDVSDRSEARGSIASTVSVTNKMSDVSDRSEARGSIVSTLSEALTERISNVMEGIMGASTEETSDANDGSGEPKGVRGASTEETSDANDGGDEGRAVRARTCILPEEDPSVGKKTSSQENHRFHNRRSKINS